LSGGFDLLETDDPKKLAEFSFMWSDLMDLRITPVLDDQELGEKPLLGHRAPAGNLSDRQRLDAGCDAVAKR
jgi:Domain of unknown function (DUF3303)